jgi:hypothetical protein
MAAPAPPRSPRTMPVTIEPDDEGPSPALPWKLTAPSWLVSMITHVALLIMLSVCYFQVDVQQPERIITALPQLPVDEMEDFEPPEIIEAPPDVPIRDDSIPAPASAGGLNEIPSVAIDADPDASSDAPIVEETDPLGEITEIKNLTAPIGGSPNVGLATRDPKGHDKFRDKITGSTETSDNAVGLGLRWIALHQRPDGSWSFDHRHGPCKTNPGGLSDAYNGATGMALMPFLGAGFTHKKGPYKEQVKAGLAYLVRQMKLKNGNQGDLSDSGTMYSHGICAIALCEAYGMTNDRELIAPAQAALNHIAYAQDPVGGGWRYAPRQPGDTSVVGWQLMALKSGHLAYLNVPNATAKGASQFLDSVQADSGSAYGYTNPGDGIATSSVGLLSRMLLGWKKDHGALQRGVQRLSETGPSKSNTYYNYYATQILCHHGGDGWKKWNPVMRDQLVDTQAKAGAEKGSWFIPGDHGSDRGGRLYCTAMATMILEVYYRISPIYKDNAVDENFPLE